MRLIIVLGISLIALAPPAEDLSAQIPVEGEVRQIVTFSFLPGESARALSVFQEQAVPLYESDEAMLTFRGFREVESPVPMDLMVVSAFQGMAGMDRSNARLREAASAAGTSIGAIYGAIGALSRVHTDQFVEMLPSLGTGDPSASRLTAFVWYRVRPGSRPAFENALRVIATGDRPQRPTPAQVGRFLLSDGWDFLLVLGFESLGEYQEYWERVETRAAYERLTELTAERRQVIVASIPNLAVREEDR